MAANLRTWLQGWDENPLEADTLPEYGVRRVVLGTKVPPSAVVGSSVLQKADSRGIYLYQPNRRFNGNVPSSYAVDLGTRPSSATFVVVGRRTINAESTSTIPFVFNTRSASEANYSGLAIGNSFASAGSKNKIYAGGSGDVCRDLYVNGVKQASAIISDNQISTNEIVVIVHTTTSMAGSEYKLFAKDDTSGGYAGDIDLYLFAELPVQPEGVCHSLSQNPWQIFARRVMIPIASAGATVPTLSSPTTTNITATTARLGLTLTF